jgi:hypothetical protein
VTGVSYADLAPSFRCGAPFFSVRLAPSGNRQSPTGFF